MNAQSSGSSRLLARFAALFTVASLLIAFGLSAGAHTPDLSAIAQPTSQVLALNYVDRVIEQGNPQFATDTLDASAVLITPEGAYVGAEGANLFGQQANTIFDGLDFQLREVDATADTMVLQGTITGINVASYRGLPANCAGIAVPGLIVLDLADGKIAQQWVSYDVETLMSQIEAFNLIDASRRPGCSTQLQPVAEAAPVADVVAAPSCISISRCELPY